MPIHSVPGVRPSREAQRRIPSGFHAPLGTRLAATLCLLAFAAHAAGAQQQRTNIRPKFSFSIGGGSESARCTDCTRGSTSIMTVAGAVRTDLQNPRFWAGLQAMLWTRVGPLAAGDHVGQYFGAAVGYRMTQRYSIYAGPGRNSESHNELNATSSGLAMTAGVEASFGAADRVGFRLALEGTRSLTGTRYVFLEEQGVELSSPFRPTIVQLVVGLRIF